MFSRFVKKVSLNTEHYRKGRLLLFEFKKLTFSKISLLWYRSARVR